MKRFESLSIREKLIRIILTITAAVFLPAAAFIVAVDFFLLRQATARSISVLAEAIAYNSSAALAFSDPEDASLVLQAFRAEPNIRKAILYDLDQEIFATFPTSEEIDRPFPADFQERRPIFDGNSLRYLVGVWEGETHLGWLLITYDLSGLRDRLLFYLAIIGLVTGAALCIAYVLSVLFQSRISGPILALKNVARRVSQEHDYSVRAAKTSDDEIGSLTQTFNEMLEQIASKEAALRVSEERLRSAVEASRTGVWDWDLKSGKATWIGSLYESIGLGDRAVSAPVSRFFEKIHPEDRLRVEEKIKETTTTGGVFEADFRVLARNGKTLYIRSRGRRLPRRDHSAERMVGVIMDVTDLRNAQAKILDLNRNLERRVDDRTAELRRALNEIEAFNYSVSHDLRTPLRGINGFSRALLEDYHDKLDDTGRDFLKRIVASCRRMGQLIDDLLKLSHITQQEMRKEKIDLSGLARESIQSLRENDPDRQIEVHIEDGMVVEGDPRLLTVVLDNLLQNAWKFTSKTERPRIDVGRDLQEGKQVFFVRDNGAGFDMSFASNLFGVFQRLHKNTEFEGTGIGLATVRRIVERHGGEVWATGALDHGATFYFSVPASSNTPNESQSNPPGRRQS